MDTVIRAVTLPVAVPLGTDPGGKPWTWGSFNARLLEAFRLSTDLANWAVHHLYRRDTPGAKDAPEAVRVRSKERPEGCYLYGDARESFPGWAERSAFAAASAQCVLRAVHTKYLRDRFDIMFRQESGLLTYRFPYPFPVHNQNWTTGYAEGGFPVVELNLPVVGGVELRLKRRADFGRQLAMFRQLHEGAAKKGEAALYRDRKGNLLVKLVGHFPRPDRGDTPNVAFVHTDPNALLVVEINGHRANVTNGDHMRRVIARHRAFRQRAGEDKKRELRMDPRQRKNLDKYIAGRCGKQNDRLKTHVYQIAAQVAAMCRRRAVGLVCYDDANREYMRHAGGELPFPWHALKTRLSQLLVGEMGCEWVDGQFAHLNDDEEKQRWLEKARATALAGRRGVTHARRKSSHPAVTKR